MKKTALVASFLALAACSGTGSSGDANDAAPDHARSWRDAGPQHDAVASHPRDAATDTVARQSDPAADANDANGGACPLGAVTFTMLPPDGGAPYEYISSFGNPGDGFWWYSLATAAGDDVGLFTKDYTGFCNACQSAAPIGFTSGEVAAGGATAVWGGTGIGASSTCTSPGDPGGGPIVCATTHCMPAGQYVVTMCGVSPSCDDPPDCAKTCIHVPFDYPGTPNVVGTLPYAAPADAGAVDAGAGDAAPGDAGP